MWGCSKFFIICFFIGFSCIYSAATAPSEKRKEGGGIGDSPRIDSSHMKQLQQAETPSVQKDGQPWYPTIDADPKLDEYDYNAGDKGSKEKSEHKNDQSSSGSGSNTSKETRKANEEKWVHKIHEAFKTWGYSDDQIPTPFGAKKDTKLSKVPPKDFEETMKKLIDEAPESMKLQLKEIVAGNKNAGESGGKPDNNTHKTICENPGKDGKCKEKVVSKDSTQASPGNIKKQSLEQLLDTIESITDRQNKLTEKEVSQIRQIVVEMAVKIHQLQQLVEDSCEGLGNRKPGGNDQSIAEIEERHSSERKLRRKQQHDDDTVRTGEEEEDEEEPFNPNQWGEPPEYAEEPGPPDQNHNDDEPNYLDGSPPDVNYNGGINRLMDNLKQEWPYGHWPDQDSDGDEENTVESDNGAKATLRIEPSNIDDDYPNTNPQNVDGNNYEKDYEVINIKEHIEENPDPIPPS